MTLKFGLRFLKFSFCNLLRERLLHNLFSITICHENFLLSIFGSPYRIRFSPIRSKGERGLDEEIVDCLFVLVKYLCWNRGGKSIVLNTNCPRQTVCTVEIAGASTIECKLIRVDREEHVWSRPILPCIALSIAWWKCCHPFLIDNTVINLLKEQSHSGTKIMWLTSQKSDCIHWGLKEFPKIRTPCHNCKSFHAEDTRAHTPSDVRRS